jgi:hypothetical protein
MLMDLCLFQYCIQIIIFYEKSRSGNKAGATQVQIYKIIHIQLDVILTQSDARLLLYVLKSFAG